jgi:hypothetical protein
MSRFLYYVHPLGRLFDKTLARRSHLFFRVELLYEPIVAEGTVDSISGFGTKSKPWIATISVKSTAGIAIGMSLTANSGSGSIYKGNPQTVVVSSFVPNCSITYRVVGGENGSSPVPGSITDIIGYYEDPLPVVKYTLSGSS